MKARLTLPVLAACAALLTVPQARAGIADSPLPVLSAGATTFHLYSVPGVISSGGLRTYFSCTSTDTATMHVGVELFDALGGAPANDDAATSLSVIAGATGIFGTGTAALGGCEKAEGVSRRLGGVYPSGPNFRPTGGRGKEANVRDCTLCAPGPR